MDAATIITNAFLAAVGSGILAVAVLLIKKLVKTMRADDLTMKAVAHDAYFRQARLLLPLKEVPEAEFENFEHLYQAYHAQGLNGTGDKLHEIIRAKPIATNKEIVL